MEDKKSGKYKGIKGKVLNLIIYAIILLTGAYLILSTIRNNILSDLVAKSNEKQQESITETTSLVMDEVVEQTLGRLNRIEAGIADDMFDDARDKVTYLADLAEKILADPAAYELQPYAGPDMEEDGELTMKVIFAQDTDSSDRKITSKVGLLVNMTDAMISLCEAYDAPTVYISLPEGVHLSVSRDSAGWFEDGQVKNYDPRTREWYQKAVEAKELVFSDGEKDAVTGVYCIECAKPVYGPDGTLQAVIGADLFLDDMQQSMREFSVEGEYYLLVNQLGHVVLESDGEGFPLNEEDRVNDLRESKIELLAQVAKEALEGNTTGIYVGELANGTYYITASSIEATGWTLISAYNEEISGQPAVLLQGKLNEIQTETIGAYQKAKERTRFFAIGALIALMTMIIAGAVVLGSRIVDPLNSMTKKISELNETNMIFKMEDEFKTGDEVQKLAESFADISERSVEYMDTVLKVTAEKERIGAELSLANTIQLNMLPHMFPAFPSRHEFDIYATMNPAKEVGGDFYDYFLIDDDHLGMVMADVSGKGVPAALFMMASKIILQSVAMLGNHPAEILNKTNEAICSNNEAAMFVTVWMGILDIPSGKLVAANGGHEYPCIKKPDGKFEIYKDKHGLVLGAMDGTKYSEYEITLEPGSKLFLYTDGLPEASDPNNVLFGMDRMIEALNIDPEAAPEKIIKTVKESVDGYVKEAEQFDDLTMLCLEYVGPNKD